jgi:S1-C subfamily serine protease
LLFVVQLLNSAWRTANEYGNKWEDKRMESERLRRLCTIAKPDTAIENNAWSLCRDITPGISALLFGTVDGVIEHGFDKIRKAPSKAIVEGAGAIGLGVALKAAPRYISVPAAIVGGAGTMLFAGDACTALDRIAPVVADASDDPERARREVSKELGPVMFETMSIMALGAASATIIEQPVKPFISAQLRGFSRHQSNVHIGPRTELRALNNYKLPVVDLRYFGPSASSKQQLQAFGLRGLVRDGFNGAKELKFHPVFQLTNDPAKHNLVRRFASFRPLDPAPQGYSRIPMLGREFNCVNLGLKPTSHPLSKIYEHAKDSVVHIQGRGQHGATWSGSGFVVSEDGKIATALHVVADAESLRVATSNGTKYDAALVAHDFDTDLAILKIAGAAPKLKPLEIAGPDAPQSPDVFLLGHPAGSPTMFLSPGIFHRRGYERSFLSTPESNRVLYSGRAFETRAYVVHDRTGDSGGPVLNSDGKVIAVHTDGDVHMKGGYDEIRVGIGPASSELTKLIDSTPLDVEPRHTVWKPHLLFPPKQPISKRSWW